MTHPDDVAVIREALAALDAARTDDGDRRPGVTAYQIDKAVWDYTAACHPINMRRLLARLEQAERRLAQLDQRIVRGAHDPWKATS